MRLSGICPTAVTFVFILKACGIVRFLDVGECIDIEIRKQGLLKKDVVLGTALVDMYSKCGALEKARKVFEQLPVKSVVSWSALIEGYAQLGEANVALNMYERMKAENFVPNLVTFTVLLTACSYAGLVKEGQMVLNVMDTVYFLPPTVEHIACMVDIFGRARHFEKAIYLIENVSSSDRFPLWLALLGACYKWVNLELGRWAFEQSLQLDKNCASAFVSMKNIYAAVGMLTEANENCGLKR